MKAIEIVSCLQCSQSLKIPNDERLLKVTCPNCQSEFKAQSGRLLNTSNQENVGSKASSGNETNKGSDAANPPNSVDKPKIRLWPFLLMVLITLPLGIISAGLFPILAGKGLSRLFAMLVFLLPFFFIAKNLWFALTKRHKALAQGGLWVLLLLSQTLFFHALWYVSNSDDSQVEKPAVAVKEFLGIPNPRTERARILMVEVRDALLTADYTLANKGLTELEGLYQNHPARFYYYRAFVFEKLNDKANSNRYSSRFLRTTGLIENKTGFLGGFEKAQSVYREQRG